MMIAVKIIAHTRFLLSSYYSGRVNLWDMDTGETIRIFKGPKSGVMALEVSPDRSLLATACYDGCLRVWRMDTAVPLAQFTADSPLLACTFSSDGKTIVAGDLTGRVLFLALKMDSRRPSPSQLQI